MAERQPDRISVNMGFTRNLGNFESMKLDIGLSSDRLDSEKSVDEHLSRVYNYIETQFLERFNHTDAEVKNIIEAEKAAKKGK